MKTWAGLLATCAALLLLACGCAFGQVLIFDMGPSGQRTWPGAQAVSPDSAWREGASFGWLSAEGLRAGRKAYEAPEDIEKLRRMEPPPVWTNPATEDWIYGDRACSFAFRAAPGKWNVWLLCGVSEGNRSQIWSFDVTAYGSIPGRSAPVGKTASIFAWPRHHYTQQRLEVYSNGAICLSFRPRSKWVVACIVAWPAENQAVADAAERAVAAISQWAPERELSMWKEDPRPPAGPEPPASSAERRRGFYVWHRHWAQVVYPWTNPAPAEKLSPTSPQPIRIFAAPGEYEPVTFTVRALRNLSRAAVIVPQAIGPIRPEHIEIRKVRYMKARPNYRVRYRYRIVPDVLERWQPGPLEGGINHRFWLTVHVPEAARPGLYRGYIQFSADGAVQLIPLVVRILNVKLSEDPGHTYGIYYVHPLDRAASAPDEFSRRWWERKAELEHADMVAHGTRNIVLSVWFPAADERGRFDPEACRRAFELLDRKIALCRKYGFVGPYAISFNVGGVYRKYMGRSAGSHLRDVKMPPEAFFREITAMVRLIEQERRRRGWPDFVYYPVDEPGRHEEAVRFMTKILQAVRAAGVKTYVTADPTSAAYDPMRPYVDVWCTQPFLPSRRVIVEDMKRRGVQYWCYPNHVAGENDHTPVAGARMTYGFGFWRSGFLRLIPWIYQYIIGDPFNYLDGRAMDFMNRTEPDGRPIPVALWEAYREGYDDYRYIYSLQRAIEAARRSRSAAARREAAEAQRTLDAIWKAIPVLPRYKYEGFWAPEEMDVRRWQIARHLERLQRLLR